MATFYTTINAGEDATNSSDFNPTLGNRQVRGLHTLGGLAYIERVYTLLGTETASDFINICPNFPEMNLIPHLCAIDAENPGTALVIDIGDADDADKYADGLTLSSGGTVLFSANAAAQKNDPVITVDDTAQGDWIVADIQTATSLTAGQKIRFRMVFSVNS